MGWVPRVLAVSFGARCGAAAGPGHRPGLGGENLAAAGHAAMTAGMAAMLR